MWSALVRILGVLAMLMMSCGNPSGPSGASGQLGEAPTLSGRIKDWDAGTSSEVEARVWIRAAKLSQGLSRAPIEADGTFHLVLPASDVVVPLAQAVPVAKGLSADCIGSISRGPQPWHLAELSLAVVRPNFEDGLEDGIWKQQGFDGPEEVTVHYIWSDTDAQDRTDFSCPLDSGSSRVHWAHDEDYSPGWNSIVTHATARTDKGVETFTYHIVRDDPPSLPQWTR